MDILATLTAKLAAWWSLTTAVEKTWLAIGLTGNLMFSMRWIIQLLASEKAKASVVPTNFWFYSLFGGLLILSYGFYRLDPVIILGQIGVLVYARNVYFLLKGQRAAAAPGSEQSGTDP